MQSLQQLRLLLWKNVVIRRRYPYFLVLELVWPILFLGIVSIMRHGAPPIKVSDCHYQKWAMPSAGIIPFLQSFVCNIDNHCFSDKEEIEKADESSRSFSALTQTILPLLSSNDLFNVFMIPSKHGGLLNYMKSFIDNKNFLNSTDEKLYIKYYIRNETEFKNIFVDNYRMLTLDEANALMRSRFNVAQLLSITEIPDFKTVACDPVQLRMLMIFPENSDVQKISLTLCGIIGINNVELIDTILQQLNFSSLIRAIKLVEEIKEIGGATTKLSPLLEEVAQMYDIIRNAEPLMRAVQTLLSMPNLVELMNKVPNIISSITNLTDLIYFIRDIAHGLNPTIVSLKMENTSFWITIKNIGLLGDNLQELLDGRWNQSSLEFLLPLATITNNINLLSTDPSGKIILTILKELSNVNWSTLLMEMLNEQKTVANLQSALISYLLQVFQNGPNVTKALFEAILTKNFVELQVIISNINITNEPNSTMSVVLNSILNNLMDFYQSFNHQQFNVTSTNQSIASVIMEFNSVFQLTNFSLSTICSLGNELSSLLDQNVQQNFIMLFGAIDLLKILPALDNLTCILFDPSGFNITAVMYKLSELGFWNDLLKGLSLIFNPPQTLNCSSHLQNIQIIVQALNDISMNNSLNINKILQCVYSGGQQTFIILSSFQQLLGNLNELLNMLQMSSVQKFFTEPKLFPLLDIIFDVITYNLKPLMKVTDLLKVESNVTAFLINMGISPNVVYTFMASSVNLNELYFLQKPVEEVVSTLCDPASLSRTINVPIGYIVNVLDISSTLCQPQANLIASYLKNASLSFDEINKHLANASTNLILVVSLLPSLGEFVYNFSKLLNFLITILLDPNITSLKDKMDVLDELSIKNVTTELSYRLQQLFMTMFSIFPEKYKTLTVQNDISTILNGLKDVDTLKIHILNEVKVKNLIKYPLNTAEYFVINFGITQKAAQEILDSMYSTKLLLGTDNLNAFLCSEIISLMFINSSQTTMQSIINEVCSLNSSLMGQLLHNLAPSSDFLAFISKYFSSIMAVIYSNTNMTTTELSLLATSVKSIITNSLEVYQLLNSSDTAAHMLENLTDVSSSAFTSVEKITQSLCGRPITDLLEFPTVNGISVSQGDIFDQLQPSIQNGRSESDLPGQFCKAFYQTIMESSFGSILWTYLKPLLRGQILYTPDNELTRAILNKANKTFGIVEEVQKVSLFWAEQSVNLQYFMEFLKNSKDLKNALTNEFIQDLIKSITGLEPDLLLFGLSSIRSISDTLTSNKTMETLQTAAVMIANYSSCILANRFYPVANETELENTAYQLSKSNTFLAGIAFFNVNDGNNNATRKKRQSGNSTMPKHIGYTIRMDVDNVMDTNYLKERTFTMSSESSFFEHLRYLRGFAFLQDLLDSAIIDIHKNHSLPSPKLNLKQMPFPCHHSDDFLFLLGTYLVPIFILFIFLTLYGVGVHTLVYDKENGQDEILHVMGMRKSINFIAWFLSTMFMMAVVSFILAVMLKYTNIFLNSNLFILFLILLDFSLSSLMMQYMVSAFFSRTNMALLFATAANMTSYLPFTIIIGYDFTLAFWQRILPCLSSTSALCFATLRIAYLEEEGFGVQWSNIDSAVGQEVSVAWSLYMMLIDSGIYFVIGWYISQIMPGKYGVGQPFYFLILPSYWKNCCTNRLPSKNIYDTNINTEGKFFEKSLQGVRIGIAVENVSKIYTKGKKALNNFSLNVYENHITTIVGHNGAAKTTAIKIICGLLKPSSGHVTLNTNNNLLGICLQKNALFYYMTVLEHMIFYAGIKGSKTDDLTKMEICRLLKDVDLWEVRNILVKKLSHGMKRRLCVALAFVGKTKTIILDEPTSGIDPHARKHIWNLITENRQGRTILLSTHSLDEADFLSDRIAIMHQRKLICCGSPTFLKHTVGGGYSMTIVKKNNKNLKQQKETAYSDGNAKIISFVQSLCPKATLVKQYGSDLTLNLPKDSSMVPLDQFFRSLDQSAELLNIASYGVTDTSLDEIFLKLNKTADEAIDFNISDDYDEIQHIQRTTSFSDESIDHRRKGIYLKIVQIGALILKRFHHYRRNWHIVISAFLLPIIFFLIACAFSSVRLNEKETKRLLLDPSIYGSGIYSFYRDTAKNEMTNRVIGMLTNSTIGYGTACMKDWQKSLYKTDGCVGNSPWYNESIPIYSVQCVDSIQTYNFPKSNYWIPEKHIQADNFIQNVDQLNISFFLLNTFKNYRDKRFGGWSFEVSERNDSLDYYVWFNTKGYHAMPSYYNALSNTILRSQLPAGENPDDYGITAVNHPLRLSRTPLTLKLLNSDAADAGLSLMIVIAFSLIPSGFVLYIVNERVKSEKHLQSISGISAFVYWTVAFMWDLVIYCITLGIAVIWVVLLKADTFLLKENLAGFVVVVLFYGLSVIPQNYCLSHLFSKGNTAYLVTFCVNLFLSFATVMFFLIMKVMGDTYPMPTVRNVFKYLFLIFPQFCCAQGLTDMSANTITYNIFIRYNEDIYASPFSADILGWKLLAMAVECITLFILNFCLDATRTPAKCFSTKDNTKDQVKIEDEDVLKEKEKIQLGFSNDLLIVNNLTKAYKRNGKKVYAVNQITFGVPRGECFGLLGVNGAGKTTTFRMLTGDCLPANGTVILKGKILSKKDKDFGQNVGYCPQEGGLDEYLTAEEMLYFHARLRGFNSSQTKAIASYFLRQLALTQYAHYPVHTYSGGTKHKLSLAVALLGNPSILYLDEPTTGMDPATRRLAWKCITQANKNGQSVVLTSHSMDECDALCSVIAIMVNGEIKCIGSPQHLKSKYGQGYTVVIHKGKKSLKAVQDEFLNRFVGSIIKANYYSSVHLEVANYSVADILSFLQTAKDSRSIECFSFTQTTMDSVFIRFAKSQKEDLQ